MEKKTLVYCNADNFFDTDCTVLRHLTKDFRVVWFPIYHPHDANHKFSLEELEQYAREYGIDYHPQVINYRRRDVRNFLRYWQILWQIRCQHPDVVYTASGDFQWHLYAPLLLDRRRVVVGFHDVEPHSNIQHAGHIARVISLRARLYQHHITHSAGQQRVLFDKYGKKSTCVGMSIKDYGPSPLKPPPLEKGIRLLFFGGIQSYKGLDLLIKAMEELYEKGITSLHLTIAGQGPHWQKCQPLIRHAEMYDLQIRYVDNAELPDLMSSHHFMVQPYRDVTNSGPMMIALNYALPLIAPDIGCFAEVYTPETALLYPQGHLTEALGQVANVTAKKYENMHKHCIDLRQQYTEQAVAARYVKTFKEVAAL